MEGFWGRGERKVRTTEVEGGCGGGAEEEGGFVGGGERKEGGFGGERERVEG